MMMVEIIALDEEISRLEYLELLFLNAPFIRTSRSRGSAKPDPKPDAPMTLRSNAAKHLYDGCNGILIYAQKFPAGRK